MSIYHCATRIATKNTRQAGTPLFTLWWPITWMIGSAAFNASFLRTVRLNFLLFSSNSTMSVLFTSLQFRGVRCLCDELIRERKAQEENPAPRRPLR